MISLTGHDGGSLVHVHVRFGHANGSDKRIVHRGSVQPYDRYVVGVRRVIVVRVRPNVRHSVIDVLRLVVRGEIVFAESYDEILFVVSAKRVSPSERYFTKSARLIRTDRSRQRIGRNRQPSIRAKLSPIFLCRAREVYPVTTDVVSEIQLGFSGRFKMTWYEYY